MKKILEDYYDIKIDNYREYYDGIVFFIAGNNYYLYKLNNEEIEYVKDIYEYVKNNSKLKIHTFILNKYNELNSDGYVLMMLNVLIEDIDINDVYLFGLCNMDKYKEYYVDIGNRWLSKIDYLEDRLNKMNVCSNVRYVFDYYSGIVEILVKFLGKLNIDSIDLVLSHKKKYNNTIDYYNPFNLIVDLRYRDLIYYLDNNNQLDKVLDYCRYVSNDDRRYMFFRIVLPSRVFELIEMYVNDLDVEDEISKYLDTSVYEEYVSKYEEIFDYYIFKQLKKEF